MDSVRVKAKAARGEGVLARIQNVVREAGQVVARPLGLSDFRPEGTDLRSEAGRALLGELGPQQLASFIGLMQHSQVLRGDEKGLWEMTSALNSMHLPEAPVHSEGERRNEAGEVIGSFRYSQAVRAVGASLAHGLTLSELTSSLVRVGLVAHLEHFPSALQAKATERFRQSVAVSVANRAEHIIVNFRGPDGRGRQGLVSAYNASADKVLLLNMGKDEAGQVQPHYEWFSVSDLARGMGARDAQAKGKTRGYVRFTSPNVRTAPTVSGGDSASVMSREGRERLPRLSEESIKELVALRPFYFP